MEIVSVRPDIRAPRGRVNLGVLVADGEALFADAGATRAQPGGFGTGRRNGGCGRADLLAHADHFGGAHFREAQGLPLLAPPSEAARMRHPFWSPSSPSPGLPVLGAPLPGHAPEQAGVVANGALFFADVLFTPDILAKHPVPFRHDAAQALKSPDVLGDHEVVAPGRGAPLEGAAVHAAIRALASPRLELAEAGEKALSVPRSGEELVGILAQRFDAQNLNLVGFPLARATVCAGAEAFSENGAFRRRGMRGSARPARRCRWPSEGLGGFAVEPHAAAVDVPRTSSRTRWPRRRSPRGRPSLSLPANPWIGSWPSFDTCGN